MYKVTPAAQFFRLLSAPTDVHSCTIVDASSLLYRPAVRAAVIDEQRALLATRLAVARWASGVAAPVSPASHASPPFRAAFYAQAQQDFFAWIERGGVWEAQGSDVAGGGQAACDLDNESGTAD